MKKTTLISIALIFLSGCLPTLYPLYHGKDLIILSGLETTWIMKDDGKTYEWTFEVNPGAKDEDDFKNIYLMRIIQDTDTVEYAGGFLKLGTATYLDMYLPYFETKLPFAQSHLFPVHTIWKVEYNSDSLKILPFNSSWIRDMIENNQVRIKHEQADAGILITAGTDELQSFVKKYGEDSRAFDSAKILIKQ
ncbi:MAG: hypothetical protein GW823_05840 [Bacteroidetes bacterium]|nr:hypothetical protein [Bacteroidota bacterium]